jgi:uncharacterized protein involved in exopolysaccharide biosynthesis
MTENPNHPEQKQNSPYNAPEEDEIDLVELALTIWKGRRTIIISTIIIVLVGLFVALFSAEEYTTTVKLMPEIGQKDGSMGRLGNLASQFGFGGASGSSDGSSIPPEYFPEIMKSLPFMQSLLNYQVYIPDADEKMDLFYYFSEYRSGSVVAAVKKYTIGLPFTILGMLRGEQEPEIYNMDDGNGKREILSFSKEEWQIIEQFRNQISVQMGEETGIVTVTVTMPEGYLAADVAEHVTTSLTQYIKEYRTEKTREDVLFIESRKAEAINRFEKAQEKLARFRDQSHGQLTQMAQTREQRLQSEYELTFSVYNSLANRLEEARINLQEETPVVKIIEPAAIPKERSAPNKPLIMLVSVFLGVITGLSKRNRRMSNLIRNLS